MLNFALVNQLKRHIEILLLDNDCVIVPDFGGFVAHQVAASYDETDRTFLPPMRTLGFNSQLRMNDSLLVHSYIEAYDISYPEALRRVEQDTEEMRQQLENEGSYTLEDLGTLTVNVDGNYEFEPFKAGLLSPDIYGLSNVAFKRLNDTAVPTEVSAEADEEKEPAEAALPTLLEFMDTEDDTSGAIEIKMSWVRNAVAIAAAIVVFFLFATPVVNSDLGNQAMSQLQGSSLLYKLMPQDTNATPAQPVVVQESTESSQNSTLAAKPAEEVPAQEPAQMKPATMPVEKVAHASKSEVPRTTYCIVVASQVRKSNAERFVEELHKQGYAEAEVFIYNDIVRVTCGTFKTEAEAYSRLNKLNDKEEFAEAWVYKKKSV